MTRDEGIGQGPEGHETRAVKLQVHEREQAVLRLLRELPDPARGVTVPHIHRFLTESGVRLPGHDSVVRDSVTMPVYYKIMRRLAVEGLVDELDPGPEGSGVTYTLSARLHADTAINLDGLRDLASVLRPTEAIAAVVDSREYVRGRRDTVMRRAAEELLAVDPRLLLEQVIDDRVSCYQADLGVAVQPGGSDPRHRQRVESQRVGLRSLCYRMGLTRAAIDVPGSPDPGRPLSLTQDSVHLEPERLREELARLIVGESAIRLVMGDNEQTPQDWETSAVSGSDGSTYASVMQVDSAAPFDDSGGSEVVTFNSSVVYVHSEPGSKRRGRLYSVPLTRSAIDSPDNAGMVMAPFMFRSEGMSESAYEHMAKCATDVVQWRADERVFTGHGKAMGSGEELPAPRVHFRDGTVTLQERESQHYQRPDSYGAMVRDGVRLSYDVLRHIKSRRNPPVFAGAVKSSQLHLFSDVVSWFIRNGSPAQGIAPVDPAWDVSRGSMLADNEAMSYLLNSINHLRRGGFFVTFAMVRPFHALTDLFDRDTCGDPEGWVRMFQERRAGQRADPGADSYWRGVGDVEDDPYVRMLQEADYVLFYVGHSSGDPAPLAPRYEFLESLRPLDEEVARQRVERNISLVVAALHHVKFTTDREHGYLSNRVMVKIVPSVVFTAHENCKALGRMLERELKSTVMANLRRLRRQRADAPTSLTMRPQPIEEFIEDWHHALAERGLEGGSAGHVGEVSA